MRFLKSKTKGKSTNTKTESQSDDNPISKIAGDQWPTKILSEHDPELAPNGTVKQILDTQLRLSKIQPHMPGYPKYKNEFCEFVDHFFA